MKIALSALHFGLFRNFESVVVELATRGHDVVLLADEHDNLGGETLADTLVARHPRIRRMFAPSCAEEPWFRFAQRLRSTLVYLRFLDPRYDRFPKLKTRAAGRAPRGLRALLAVPGVNSRAGRHAVSRALNALDAALPRNAAMDQWLAVERPDVLLLASTTMPRAPQLDHLRSARAAGIPTIACVYSWDHLSSKGLIRIVPDRVLVWNDTQKQEAIDMHGLPAERIVVTGAQVYDQWFGRRPSRSPSAFARDAGLPTGRPFLMYVCSALTPEPGESTFVRQWIKAIRGSGSPDLRDVAFLIRPHPERREGWENRDWQDLGDVVVTSTSQTGEAAKADYFDALHYSSAVVGLVTSSFLEAAIAGRPVLTVTPPEMRVHQEGMLHFRYLLEVEDGLLTVARTLVEHVRQLEAAVRGGSAYQERQQRFLKAFVRPFGLERPATPLFVESVEAVARLRPEPEPDSRPHWQRALARHVVGLSHHPLLRAAMLDEREAAEVCARNRRVRAHRKASRRGRRRARAKSLITGVYARIRRLTLTPSNGSGTGETS
ncbi:MAG: hypothetical protein AB1806_18160 [Acidobacteriota bacterium]